MPAGFERNNVGSRTDIVGLRTKIVVLLRQRVRRSARTKEEASADTVRLWAEMPWYDASGMVAVVT
jgi:hypothetical protein